MDVLDYLYINGERQANPLPKQDTKTDISGYYKTPTGAVVSKDNEALQSYKLRKSKESQINNMKQEITDIRKDLEEIKELLRGITK